jgi:hypothetical protein
MQELHKRSDKVFISSTELDCGLQSADEVVGLSLLRSAERCSR